MKYSARLAREIKEQGVPTKELVKEIGEVLDLEYNEEAKGWTVEKWESVQDFINDRGNYEAKWIIDDDNWFQADWGWIHYIW